MLIGRPIELWIWPTQKLPHDVRGQGGATLGIGGHHDIAVAELEAVPHSTVHDQVEGFALLLRPSGCRGVWSEWFRHSGPFPPLLHPAKVLLGAAGSQRDESPDPLRSGDPTCVIFCTIKYLAVA